MSTRAWVIWIIVIVVLLGGGFGVYWYLHRASVSASEEGTNISATSSQSNTVMSVKEGWNFVGFPYNTVTTVSDLLTKIGASDTLKAIYRWSGQEWVDVAQENVLKPGTGYLTYFNSAGQIDLGDTGATSYPQVVVPVETDKWQMVAVPILDAIAWRGTGTSTTEFLPHSGFSIKLTDGGTLSMLEAIQQGLVATPLFLDNQHPNYSYTYLYDLTLENLPAFSAFWFLPKSSTVEGVIFSTQGGAGTAKISKTDLEKGSSSSGTPLTP